MLFKKKNLNWFKLYLRLGEDNNICEISNINSTNLEKMFS